MSYAHIQILELSPSSLSSIPLMLRLLCNVMLCDVMKVYVHAKTSLSATMYVQAYI